MNLPPLCLPQILQELSDSDLESLAGRLFQKRER